MGVACSTYGERSRADRVFVGQPEERNHLEDLGVDGKVILIWIFKKWDGGLDWICMAQDRDRWRNFVNGVMNFRFHIMRRNINQLGTC